jgi:hypothetical protein
MHMPSMRGAKRRARRIRPLAAALGFGLLAAACSGGSNGSGGVPGTVKTDSAAAGAGGASSPVPIAVMPGAGPCPASGTQALQSPLLNTQLRCAP